jgi:hypothetical protein
MAGLQLNSPQFRDLLRRAVRVFGLYLLVAVIGHLLEDVFQVSGLMPADGRGDPPIVGVVFVSIVTFAWTLVSQAIQLTAAARQLFAHSAARGLSFMREVELISIETLRAISATLLRLPLLLLPGVFEWIRLTPISFIVLLDTAYQNGERDALAAARIFFRRHKVRVLSLLLLSMSLMLVEFSVSPDPSDSLPLWQAPFQHIGSILIFSILRVIVDTVTLASYRSKFPKLTAPVPAGSNVL